MEFHIFFFLLNFKCIFSWIPFLLLYLLSFVVLELHFFPPRFPCLLIFFWTSTYSSKESVLQTSSMELGSSLELVFSIIVLLPCHLWPKSRESENDFCNHLYYGMWMVHNCKVHTTWEIWRLHWMHHIIIARQGIAHIFYTP